MGRSYFPFRNSVSAGRVAALDDDPQTPLHSAQALMGQVFPPLKHVWAAQLQVAPPAYTALVAGRIAKSAETAIPMRYLFMRPP